MRSNISLPRGLVRSLAAPMERLLLDRGILDSGRDLEIVPDQDSKRSLGPEQSNNLSAVVLMQQKLSKEQDLLLQEPQLVPTLSDCFDTSPQSL